MFVKFPSIEQFRNTVSKVSHKTSFIGLDSNGQPCFDYNRPKPVIEFTGTVKVHGTNAGLTKTVDGKIIAQKRNSSIVAPGDNAGFRVFVESLPSNVLDGMFSQATNYANSIGVDTNQPITIFGEWAGENIQKGVAVEKLPKFFYIFALKFGDQFIDHTCLLECEEHRIFNSKRNFPVWKATIDFNDATQIANVQNFLVEVTEKVEKECPVAARFGEKGIGEGVVWTCHDFDLTFKVKGEAHSSSHVTKLASADVEKIATIQAFVNSVVTESRIEQAISVLKEENKPVDKKSTGDIVRWVVNDVIKEESDTIEKNGLDMKQVCTAVGNATRVAYFNKVQ